MRNSNCNEREKASFFIQYENNIFWPEDNVETIENHRNENPNK